MSIRNYGILDQNLMSAVAASGLENKIRNFLISGFNPDVDTANIEDVWDVGGQLTYETAPTTVDIVSTSANDALGGSNIEYVLILGLDENYNILPIERVDLNGLTPVTSTQSYLRILSVFGRRDTVTDRNISAAGNITFTGTTVIAQIAIGQTQDRMAMSTIPRNYTGFVDFIFGSGRVNDDFAIRFDSAGPDQLFTVGNPIEVSDGRFVVIPFARLASRYPEKTDIKLSVQAIANNAQVSATMGITLIRNDYLESLANSV